MLREVDMNRHWMPMKLAIAAAGVALYLPAYAADLSVPYRKALPPPQYNWAGFYVGANLGGTLGSETGTIPTATYSFNPSGVLGGVQAGYNMLAAPNWLVGIEGDLDWTFTQDNLVVPDPVAAPTVTSDHRWYATLDARAGWVQGPLLLYAKAGAAWMNADYTVSGAFGGGAPAIMTVNNTQTGWTIGAGAEYLFGTGWSGKAEYDVVDFGSVDLTPGVPIIGLTTQVHQFKVGLNYHLLWGL
jgi:opacity protein-like surface antigen